MIGTYAKQLEDIGADMKSVSSRDLQQNVPRHPLTILKPLHQVESTELPANIPLSPIDNIATAHPLSQSSTINSKKRPISPTAENETPRKVRTISTSLVQEPPQTPKQLMQPQNSGLTGDSIDATVEDDSKDMTKQFIRPLSLPKTVNSNLLGTIITFHCSNMQSRTNGFPFEGSNSKYCQ